MLKKAKPKIEFRYYRMPAGCPVLALLGKKWCQVYGREIDYLHFHNYLEIGYCYEGTGSITLGETDHRFLGGEFTVIPKNYPHTTVSDPDVLCKWEYLFIDTSTLLHELYPGAANARQVDQLLSRIHSQAFFKQSEDAPLIASLIRHCFEVMRNADEYHIEEIKSATATLLINIARLSKGKKDTAEASQKISLPISNALDYISMHYMEPLMVRDLADYCHMSETHFRRTFSEYMNLSPLEYINRIRIQTACDYLKRTDWSVSSIAHKCGFTTLSTFNRNFRQVMNIAPNEWRRQPENFEQQLLKFRIHSEEGW